MLIIDAELTEPPSEVFLFRDITLYSECFLKHKVLVECEKQYRDYYYKWLKNNNAYDFVYDFVKPRTEYGVSIRTQKANIVCEKIDYNNFAFILSNLRRSIEENI